MNQNQGKDLTVIQQGGAIANQGRGYEMDVFRVLDQTVAVQQLMARVLKEGEHYGTLPGIKTRPGEQPEKMLFKSGAEKLCMLFRLRPQYEFLARVEEEYFLSFTVCCRLYNIPTGELWGEGIGSINTREAKYLNQCTARACPECGQPAIIRGRPEHNGGTANWICYDKKGGCGAKFRIDDPAIIEQSGKISSPKVWELHNTMVKMVQKRAMVAAVLTATGASDIFGQDLEELLEDQDPSMLKPKAQPAQQQQARKPAGAPSVAPNDVMKLNGFLADNEVSVNDRMEWINGMIRKWGEKPIENVTEISAALMARLLEAAARGERPGDSKPAAEAPK